MFSLLQKLPYVALFARAWIEIPCMPLPRVLYSVALFARAWIEIVKILFSLPSATVALFARAWIEMPPGNGAEVTASGRPLCEGVD